MYPLLISPLTSPRSLNSNSHLHRRTLELAIIFITIIVTHYTSSTLVVVVPIPPLFFFPRLRPDRTNRSHDGIWKERLRFVELPPPHYFKGPWRSLIAHELFLFSFLWQPAISPSRPVQTAIPVGVEVMVVVDVGFRDERFMSSDMRLGVEGCMLPEKDRPRCTSLRRATSLGPVCQSQGSEKTRDPGAHSVHTLFFFALYHGVPAKFDQQKASSSPFSRVHYYSCFRSTRIPGLSNTRRSLGRSPNSSLRQSALPLSLLQNVLVPASYQQRPTT